MESLLPEREGAGYSRRRAGIHPSVNKGRQGGTPYWLVVFGGHIYASMAGPCMLWHGAGHGSTTGPALPLIGRDVWLSWLLRSFQFSALTCHDCHSAVFAKLCCASSWIHIWARPLGLGPPGNGTWTRGSPGPRPLRSSWAVSP
jgi:hypothetical protein